MMKKSRLIIGSRGSRLALLQAELVASELARHFDGEIEIRVIKTTGDTIQDVPLSRIGSKGLFVKEIESALLQGEVDLAVHSMKDMPTELPEGLTLAGTLKREDPRDAFISLKYRAVSELDASAVIATGSLRRKSQMLHLLPGLTVVGMRGNVDTRLRKLEEGVADGLIMAAAGLIRMKMSHYITELLNYDVMLPAVGQGSIAIEARDDSAEVRELIDRISWRDDFLAVKAERALMRKLEGGCQIPVAALAEVHGDIIVMDAMVSNLDGTVVIRDRSSASLENPEDLGTVLAEMLIKQGADKILREIKQHYES
ncbi:MAG: hydroxymethylbilane synthase [Candidatus Xenobiia bacterium LiM19]